MRFAFVYQAFECIAFERFSTLIKNNKDEIKLFFDPALFRDYSLQNKYLAKLLNPSLNKILTQIKKYNPDYVFFSVFTDSLIWNTKLAYRIKKICPSTKIVFGGPHISICGDDIKKRYSFIDYLVKGEGESFLYNILHNKNNNISENWKVLPCNKLLNIHEDKELFYEKMPYHRRYYATSTSFGCYNSCSFCIHSFYKKNKKHPGIKRKNIDFVINSLIKSKKNGAKKVIFYDDNFLSSKNYSTEFLNKYIKYVNLPFMCIAHPDDLNLEIINLLKRSNCINIEIGTQILNDKIKNKYLNRYESNISVIKALSILKEKKISVTVDHILGLPDESLKDHLYSLYIYKKYGVSRILLSHLTCYPGIEINSTMLKKKRISKKVLKNIKWGKINNFQFKGSVKKDKEIESLEFLFEWLPFIPERLFNKLLDKEKITKLPKSKLISKYIPFLLKTFSRNEYNLELYVKRYIYFFLKKIRF